MRKTVGIIMLIVPFTALFAYWVATHGVWIAIGSFIASIIFAAWTLLALGLISSSRRIQ